MKYIIKCPTAVRHAGALVLAVFGVCQFSAPCSAASQRNMPPGAYLARPATSAANLAEQVRSNKLVAQRYARLFHMSPQMVRTAFSDLRLTHLTSERLVRVYYVHSGEKLGFKVRRLPKGTAIYALPDGTPMLAQVCGNPLRHILRTASAIQYREQIPVFNANEPVVDSHRNSLASRSPAFGTIAYFQSEGFKVPGEDWVEEPNVWSFASDSAAPSSVADAGITAIAENRL